MPAFVPESSPSSAPASSAAPVSGAVPVSGVRTASVVDALARAREFAARADWAGAARLYIEVLTSDPEQAQALAGVGEAELQLGRPARALPWLTRAERAAPTEPRIVAQLGVAQKLNGMLAPAIASYQRALELDAAQASVWVNLGRALREAGRLQDATSAFRRALVLEPQATTWSMLSNALREAGNYAEAVAAARSALVRDPWLAEAHLNEGAALHLSDRVAAGAASYFVASLLPATREPALRNLAFALGPALSELEAKNPVVQLVRRLLATPEDVKGLLALAQLLKRERRAAVAVVCFERALAQKADPRAHRELGRLLWELGFRDKAERALLAAIAADPSNVDAYRLFGAWFCTGEHRPRARWQWLLEQCPDDAIALAKLGGVAQRLGQPLLAQRSYQRLVRLKPQVVEGHFYLGTALTEQGACQAASQAFQRALDLDRTRWDVYSSLLFCLHLDPEQSSDALFERHRAFGRALAESLPPPSPPAPRLHEPRKLRIGYVSPDLCAHPINYFLEPVLREHDHTKFEIYCYSDVKRPDAATAQLSALADAFISVNGLSHDQLCARIRADEIDILVDLAGHTAGNRLPVFARKPSPIQASWLGYFDTTGLAAIDYRIADESSVSNSAERHFIEHVVRLPRSANCYKPPPSPAPAPPPCLERGYITFGCFNNPAKISREVCRVFARVLHAVPASRLFFKYRSFNDVELRQRFLGWLSSEGIAAERVRFAGSSAMPEFLATFSEIDIALDPFPYSGETTALHTLWMGVPLVALEGPTLVQRLASRVLRIAGFEAWIAEGEERYVAIAAALAGDVQALSGVRRELRARLEASPLLDHRGVTRDLEDAYRWMWQTRTRGGAGRSRA